MTDNEIIKALECCLLSNEQQEERCAECPMCETPLTVCQHLLSYHALDLIKRQKAEIEGLTYNFGIRQKNKKATKSEAIKEYAERFNALANAAFSYEDSYHDPLATVKRLTGNLVKEMVGDIDG